MATFGTFVDGNSLKASEINDWFVISSATTTATQGVSLTTSSQTNRLFRINKFVFWNCNLNFASAGTASNAVVVNLPVTAASGSFRAIGFGRAFVSGPDIKLLTVVKASTTTVQFFSDDGTSLTDRFGVNPAVTISSGASIIFSCMYEAA